MLKKIYINILLVFISFYAYNQDIGAPFIKYHNFKDYGGHAQIWTIAEDNNGLIYFGSTTEVNIFDGETWRHIYLPQKANVRSLFNAKSGVIYVGGSNEFGYLKPDTLGKMQYISLVPKLDSIDNKFSDIWEIYEDDIGVYFRSNQKLFRYNEKYDTIKVWTSQTRFFPMSYINGVGIVIREGDTYFKIQNDEFIELPSPLKFKGLFIYRMFNFEHGKALCVAANNLFIYDFLAPEGTDPLTIFETNVDDEFAKTHLYMGCTIADSAFAITTLTKGVFIINKNGKLIERINKDDGLKYNHVWVSLLSKNKTLWLGMDKGISQVDIATPVRFWNANNGLDDALNSVYKYKNSLFVAGMTGVYKISLDSNKKLYKFPNLTYNAWFFNEIKASDNNDEQLLIASSKGLYSISGDSLRLLSNISYNNFTFQSKINPGIIYATSLNAVYAFKFSNNELIPVDTLNFEGLSIRLLEKEDKLWISTFFKGNYSVEVSPFNEQIFNKNSLSRYDTLKGFFDNLQIKALNVNNNLFFTSTKGLFEYSIQSDSMILTDKFNIENNKNIQFGFLTYILGKAYMIRNNQIIVFDEINEKFILSDTLKFKAISNKSKNFLYLDSMLGLYTTGFDGLFWYKNTSFDTTFANKYTVFIRKVIINEDSVIFYGNYSNLKLKTQNEQIDKFEHVLQYSSNNVAFEYASPYFVIDEKVEYSYKLEGFDKTWSSWSNEAKNKYTNLREGIYTFKVKALNIYGVESIIASYSFKIQPPWYRSVLAYISYILLFVVVLYISVRFFTRRLKRQNIKLERLVNKRTAEINQQKEEILTKNEELMQQQEEILAQRDELEAANIQLEKLSVVASQTDNSVFIMSPDGSFVWANEAFERIYGYSYNQFIDQHHNIFSYMNDKNLAEKVRKQVFDDKKTFRYNSPILTKSGKEVWLQTTFTPILDYDKSLRMVAAVESDISKLKDFEYQILMKNDLIESSIRYAQTIQKSILPPKADFNKYFDNFIIFRPKDVVSGDFYWLVETTKYVFTAVVDCTGHGVPGAFMSLIGSRMLTSIVKEKKIHQPSEILTELDKGIIKTLHQQDTENQDGMDLILCRFDKNKMETNIKIATAKRPVVYSKNSEIIRQKGTSRSIGGYRLHASTIKFEDLSLNTNDVIYLFSDGYPDQNNVKREKFKTSQLLRILSEFAENNSPIEKQKLLLEQNLDDWSKGTTQRDDICIIGLKIKNK